jgi:hypothetical protein
MIEVFMPSTERAGAANQRLGLGEVIHSLEQQGQILELDANTWMIGAEILLVDGERTSVERFRLGKPSCRLKQ